MTQRSANLVVAIACIAVSGSALAERSLLLDPGEASEVGNCDWMSRPRSPGGRR